MYDLPTGQWIALTPHESVGQKLGEDEINLIYLWLLPMIGQSATLDPLPSLEGMSRAAIVASVLALIETRFLDYEFKVDKDMRPTKVRFRFRQPRKGPWKKIEVIRPN